MTHSDTDNHDQKEELDALLKQVLPLDLPHVHFKDIAAIERVMPQDGFTEILTDFAHGKKGPYTLIDVRSEAEFERERLPFAVNIPILTNTERHQVGLIYKRHDKDLALSYAWYLAKQKEEAYLEKVRKLAQGGPVILYCWRGGGRSRYTTSMLNKNGIDAVRLNGGQKAFRKEVHTMLYEQEITLYPLSGQTGCGKSELLEYIQANHRDLPALHLEAAAGHAASVFGEIRFNLMGESLAKSQRDFETNLYVNLLQHRNADGSLPPFLTEMESKKIGRFNLPPSICKALAKETHIGLTCPLETRLARLEKEYFGKGGKEVEEMVKEAVRFLTRRVGKETVERWCAAIDAGDYRGFLKEVMVDYYDKVYKAVDTPPLFTVSNIDSGEAAAAIATWYHSAKE
ncbi:tRNA 2-selenouridine(34) synthase MnmH [Desulfoluna spongiiphila]|uniref:tRNA 2-selenouridine(34) synthase MnmH n=1 Tax=Desulfoluna spongiiphila TaxID=419481 RepID=UPI00125BBA77|nr:tRNA 2-selenouridine(34) synthase MnmH [Desulfoluna spongiiphila]VVS93455.1 trna 2-selenouridine synthase [Desulfoluna spongiiphila]